MERVEYDNGAVRESRIGKGVYKYMPMKALMRLADRYEYGARKYGATDNFKKGLPASDCWDSAFRHLIKYMDGDNSEDHLAAAVWNIFTIIEMEHNNPKYQDIESRKRYKQKDLDYKDKEVI